MGPRLLKGREVLQRATKKQKDGSEAADGGQLVIFLNIHTIKQSDQNDSGNSELGPLLGTQPWDLSGAIEEALGCKDDDDANSI
jgi:hypothetical protein